MCLEDHGYFCSYTISFFSPKTTPLQLDGASGVVKGTIEFVAEALFETFVSESSDQKIEAAVNTEMGRISTFCEVPEHRVPCRQK